MTFATSENLTTLQAADVFAACGVSAIPIHAPLLPGTGCTCHKPGCQDAGKHPALSEWRAYIKRRPTPEETGVWFGGPEPRNVAVICGQVSDGLTVIDCDDPATYNALCYTYRDLRETLTVKTGKGYHLYCYSPGELKTVTFMANGLKHHVKAEGGYVVAPPSIHRSGNVYRWLDPERAPLTLDLERLAAALKRLGASQADPQPQVAREQGWAARLLREGSRMGSRDDEAIRLSGYLVNFLPYDTCLAILDLWASRCDQAPHDPFGLDQVQAKLDSAWRMRERREVTTPS